MSNVEISQLCRRLPFWWGCAYAGSASGLKVLLYAMIQFSSLPLRVQWLRDRAVFWYRLESR